MPMQATTGLTDEQRAGYEQDGFVRLPVFAEPDGCQAMFDRVIALARPGANHGYVEIVDHHMSGAVPVLMDPGDLLVFDGHLMHRSTDNTSTGKRGAMVFHYAATGTVDHTPRRSRINDFVTVRR
jgi:ectoine hydroxylase-related dioxygenase (phytanoyl-CoA dioxygenase family)